jgi:hypothetical protein
MGKGTKNSAGTNSKRPKILRPKLRRPIRANQSFTDLSRRRLKKFPQDKCPTTRQI